MNAFQTNKLAFYFIAGTQDLAPKQTLPELLEKAIRGGITAFQYREKGPNSLKDAHALEEMARTLQAICRKHQVLFFINDDLELALTIQADEITLAVIEGDGLENSPSNSRRNPSKLFEALK